MQPFGDSFSELKARVRKHMRDEKINDYVLDLIKGACERAFAAQKVVLSKPEKELLLQGVTKEILTDLLEQSKP